MRDDQLYAFAAFHERVQVVCDRRQAAAAVDQDGDVALCGERKHRIEAFVLEGDLLRARMQLDPAGARVEAASRLLYRRLVQVEADERDQAPLAAGRVCERPVVRRAERRLPVRLVEAEHEGAADGVLVHHPEQLVVVPGDSVDVVAEMDVRVEDLRVRRQLAAQLVAPGVEQLVRAVERGHQSDDRLLSAGPTYAALGRISRPVRFCSTMCADQPAVRAHATSAGVIAAGISAISSTTAPQNSTFVSSGRSGYFSRSASIEAFP